MKLRLSTLLCLLFSSPSTFSRRTLPIMPPLTLPLRPFAPREIRAHIRFLADSLLQGRAPGTPGYDIAARYVATELEGMGLHPRRCGQLVSTCAAGKGCHRCGRQFSRAHDQRQRTEID